MLPTYLPHFLDEEPASEDQPIFFGGINVPATQVALFRHTPACSTRLTASGFCKAAARSGMASGRIWEKLQFPPFRGRRSAGKGSKSSRLVSQPRPARSAVFVGSTCWPGSVKSSSENLAFLCTPFFKEKIPWILFFLPQ